MKKALTKKVTAAITLAAMTMSAVACGDTQPAAEQTPAADQTPAAESTAAPAETTAAEAEDDGIIKDADGNPIDLGGMEIIIRDWWSGDPAEPQND